MGREGISELRYAVVFCEADVACIEVTVPAGGLSALARDLSQLLGASASASDEVANTRGDGRPAAYSIVRPEGFRAILADAAVADGPARLVIARTEVGRVWARAKAVPTGSLRELFAGLTVADRAIARDGRGRSSGWGRPAKRP